MKLFHLSDLHLGKRLNEYPLKEDQEFILQAIIDMMDAEKPDALMICGDVYDKAIPPAEAVTLFDDFLWEVSQREVPTLIISGNQRFARSVPTSTFSATSASVAMSLRRRARRAEYT